MAGPAPSLEEGPAARREEVEPQGRRHRNRPGARRLLLGGDGCLNDRSSPLVRRGPGGRGLHHAPEHRRCRVDPRNNCARHRHGRPQCEAPTCATLSCGPNPRTSVWRQVPMHRSGAWSSSRPSAAFCNGGACVAAATPVSRTLRFAADLDTGSPPPARDRPSAERLVRRALKTAEQWS